MAVLNCAVHRRSADALNASRGDERRDVGKGLRKVGPWQPQATIRALDAAHAACWARRPDVSCRNEGINLVARVGAVRCERASAGSAVAMPFHEIGRMCRDRQPRRSVGTSAHANVPPRVPPAPR